MGRYTFFFDELGQGDPSVIGGKAFNLCRIRELTDLKIPKGFVIKTNAYWDYLKENNLKGKLSHILLEVSSGREVEISNLFRVSDELVEVFSLGKLGKKFKSELDYALDVFKEKSLAVRSSADIEDGSGFSMAGQFDSFLNVEKDDVPKAVVDCWASIFSPRAIKQIVSNNILPQETAMAVIIQEMITPDFSGVIFTKDPSDPDSCLLEVVEGHNRNLVQGQSIPNSYTLNRKTTTIEEKSEYFNFDLELVRLLSAVGRRIEYALGSPQDIEFAISGNQITILQSRMMIFPALGSGKL